MLPICENLCIRFFFWKNDLNFILGHEFMTFSSALVYLESEFIDYILTHESVIIVHWIVLA